MSESMVQLFAPFYFGLCAVFPEFNIAAFISIGKFLYEPRLSIIYPVSLNHINLVVLIIHLFIFGKKVRVKEQIISHISSFLIFITWLILSALIFTRHPGYAFDKIISLIVISLPPIWLVSIRTKLTGEKPLRNLLWSILFISISLAVLGIMHWLQSPGIYRLTALGGGPIGLARIAGAGLIILILQHHHAWQPFKYKKYYIYTAETVLAVTLLMTLTKGPLISLVISLLLANRIISGRWLSKKRMIIGSLAVIAACVIMDMFRQAGSPEINVWYGSYVIRMEHFIHAFNAFMHHPVLGIGLGNFSDWEPGWLYPHNLFMEVLSESGLTGLILLGFVVYPIFIDFFYKKTKNQTIFFILTLFILLNQMVSSDIIGARFLWFYYYLYIISTYWNGKNQDPKIRRLFHSKEGE